eukprot:scaffold26941_cov49-Cyclotella_meneghiniana.AAC.5
MKKNKCRYSRLSYPANGSHSWRLLVARQVRSVTLGASRELCLVWEYYPRSKNPKTLLELSLSNLTRLPLDEQKLTQKLQTAMVALTLSALSFAKKANGTP